MIYSENILICIAVPLIVSMLFIQSHARRFVLGFLFGMATCLLAAYISGYIDLVAGNGRDWLAVLRPCWVYLALGLVGSTPLPSRLWRKISGSGAAWALLFALFWLCVYFIASLALWTALPAVSLSALLGLAQLGCRDSK